MLGARVSTTFLLFPLKLENLMTLLLLVFFQSAGHILFSPEQPPKKEYLNYKMLQQQVKEKKQKAKEEVQPVRPAPPVSLTC